MKRIEAEDRACPDCGHGWDYHGPEVPGCCECRCLLTLTSGRRYRHRQPEPEEGVLMPVFEGAYCFTPPCNVKPSVNVQSRGSGRTYPMCVTHAKQMASYHFWTILEAVADDEESEWK